MDANAVEAPVRAKVKVTAMPGDGIGPEVMRATQTVLAAAGAQVEWEEALAGAEAFKNGIAAGAPQETLDSIARNGVALKGPLETPVGFGDKSANVTLRKTFEMYGNVRPVRELPGIRTPFSGRGIDFVVVRENVEDVYAGIEHMQTPGVAQCLKIITEVGCERIGMAQPPTRQPDRRRTQRLRPWQQAPQRAGEPPRQPCQAGDAAGQYHAEEFHHRQPGIAEGG
jgi:isocitrate dehydrogenase